MPIDSRDKRAAAMGGLLMPSMPLPDGNVPTESDRSMISGVYPIGAQGVTSVGGNLMLGRTHHFKPHTHGR